MAKKRRRKVSKKRKIPHIDNRQIAKVYQSRSYIAKKVDASRTAKQTYPLSDNYGRYLWIRHPEKIDLIGIDTKNSRIVGVDVPPDTKNIGGKYYTRWPQYIYTNKKEAIKKAKELRKRYSQGSYRYYVRVVPWRGKYYLYYRYKRR